MIYKKADVEHKLYFRYAKFERGKGKGQRIFQAVLL